VRVTPWAGTPGTELNITGEGRGVRYKARKVLQGGRSARRKMLWLGKARKVKNRLEKTGGMSKEQPKDKVAEKRLEGYRLGLSVE